MYLFYKMFTLHYPSRRPFSGVGRMIGNTNRGAIKSSNCCRHVLYAGDCDKTLAAANSRQYIIGACSGLTGTNKRP